MAARGDSCSSSIAGAHQRERRILIIALFINAGMFVLEFSTGLSRTGQKRQQRLLRDQSPC